MDLDPPHRKQIVRSSRPRLSERHVAPKDQGLTSSMPRLTEDVRPSKPHNIQNVRKWVKFLRSVLKSKLVQNMQSAFDRLRILTASKYGKEHLMAYRLKKLFAHIAVSQKETAMRRVLLETLRVNKSNGSATVTKKNELFSKSITNVLNLLDSKFKGNLKFVLLKLSTNRKLVNKVSQFSKTSFIRSFGELVKTKLLAGFLKIKGHANWSKNSKGGVVKCLKNLEGKVNINKIFAFQRIKAKVAQVKKQLAEKETQPVEEEKKSEEVIQSPPTPVQKPPDRRLIANVDRVQTQVKNLKLRQEKELAQKQRKLQELQAHLAELNQQNEIESRIQHSPMAEFKKQQEHSFVPKTKVYENIFSNFLFFLKNSEQIITKDKVIESLLVPMSRVDMPIETIRLENEVLEQVLEQYKKLKLKVPPKPPRQPWFENKPYEYLLKQNRELYDILKELVESNDASINSKNLEQLARDFEQLQIQLSAQNIQKA